MDRIGRDRMVRYPRMIVGVVATLLMWSASSSAFQEPPLIPVSKPSGGKTWIVGTGGDFADLEAADGNVSPGDIIRVKAGTYPIVQWGQSGTAGNPIWIEAYGDGDAVFYGEGTGSNPVNRADGDYIVVDGGPKRELVFRCPYAASSFRVNGGNVVARRIKALDAGYFSGTDTGTGIIVRGDYAKVYNNYVTGAEDEGIYVGINRDGADIRDIEIRNNIISTQGSGIQWNPHGSGAGNVTGTHIVAGNFIYSGGDKVGNTRPGITINSSDALLRGEIYIYNNMVYDYEHGIAFGQDLTGVQIYVYNNTLYKNRVQGLRVKKNINFSGVLRNNISFDNGMSDLLSTTGNTLVVSDTLTTDPSFVSTDIADSDFMKLGSSSAAIDAGYSDATIAAMVTVDFAFDPRPRYGGIDIGAYEYAVEAPGSIQLVQ